MKYAECLFAKSSYILYVSCLGWVKEVIPVSRTLNSGMKGTSLKAGGGYLLIIYMSSPRNVYRDHEVSKGERYLLALGKRKSH